jgi:hypothetical protein
MLRGASAESSNWIDWIRDFIARIDPLTAPPTMPTEPETAPEDLKPFRRRTSVRTGRSAGSSTLLFRPDHPDAARRVHALLLAEAA